LGLSILRGIGGGVFNWSDDGSVMKWVTLTSYNNWFVCKKKSEWGLFT